MVYIHPKAAFDSIDRAALWKSLEEIGTPTVIVDLLRDLHTHTTSRLRVGDEYSQVISTTCRVPQGCVLALDLVCRAVDWLMLRVVELGCTMVALPAVTVPAVGSFCDQAGVPAPTSATTAAALPSCRA